MAALSRLTNRPVRFLVNTNADADHIAGNELVVKSQRGTRGPRPGGGGGGAQARMSASSPSRTKTRSTGCLRAAAVFRP